MNIVIKPHALNGSIRIISSKSISHRYVIAAGLAQGKSVIHNVLDSDDLDATKDALRHFGASFNQDEIVGTQLQYNHQPIQCKESGSTLRFMIPIALMQDQEVVFMGEGRLPQRPLNVYRDVFKDKEVVFESLGKDELPLKVKGILPAGHYVLRGDVSSQFISGLLFALPLAKRDSEITYLTPLTSKDYVSLTLDVIQSFGINVIEKDNGLFIPGNQIYQPVNACVEGDYSQAAFFMVAGLIGKKIELSQLNPSSKQGDRAIIDVIKKMGGRIEYCDQKESFIVYPSQTKATTIDLTHIPDLGPILMVLAALSQGTTHFMGVSRLRIKESDRLEKMYQALTLMEIDMIIENDEAWITGKDHLKGSLTLDGASDHRIVMALAIASIRADGPVTITHAEAISKSFPTFFKRFEELGGITYESQ